MIKAVEGCSYIVHVASPVAGARAMTEAEYIEPATTGMRILLKAAVVHKVKRIVLTSTVDTILGALFKHPDVEYSESDFAPEAGCGSYEKSKIRQE